MLVSIIKNWLSCWHKLLVADFVFKAISFILLAPALSFVFRLFVSTAGKDVLADTDILLFLQHPLGIAAFIICSALLIAVFAIEIVILMTVALCKHEQRTQSIRSTFGFVFQRARLFGILKIAVRVVLELLIWAVPLVALGGGIYWGLLTDHDINFYLTEKPPKFWLAVAGIGSCLITAAGLCVWRLANYSLVMQVFVFEDQGAAEAMAISRQRVLGHRAKTAWLLVLVALCDLLIASALTVVAGYVGKTIILASVDGTAWVFAVAVGVSIGLVAGAQLLSNSLANGLLGSALVACYTKFGSSASRNYHLPPEQPEEVLLGIQLTPLHIGALLIGGVLVAGFLGHSVVNSFQVEDDVVITAHRGGAVKGPENTLAAIEQAVADGTDWVEIDVQESLDGVVMVAHDSDLKKVAGEPVKIWEATAQELRQIDIGSYFGPEFSDQRVPTLDEVLKVASGRVNVNIELKYYGHDQDLERKVVDLVEANDMQDHIVIMSLKQAGLDKIKKLRPDWTCGLLTAVSIGDLSLANADFLAVHESLATPRFVQQVHSRGKEVAAWTLNDAITISRMLSRGIDNVITDDVVLVKDVLAQRRRMSSMERNLMELAVYFGVEYKAADLFNPK